MKKFLLTSGVFLLVALAAVIVVFVYLSSTITPAATEESPAPDESGVATNTDSTTEPSGNSTTTKVEEPAPVSLNEDQTNRLREFGVDISPDSITPEMITCAEEVLGRARAEEIVGGAEPSLLEVGRLLPCLGA